MVVAGRDLGLAHRERLADSLHRTEAALALLRLVQGVEVDLDVVNLLHAADVRVPPLLVRVEERAGARDAGGRVDDLVAMNPAAATFSLVLWPQGKLLNDRQSPLHPSGLWVRFIRPARLDTPREGV